MRFYPQHYTPRFQQHVWSLMHNGFYTRALDADDFAFIEGIRERGCIGNGPIADSPPALIEELGYWERHWDVEDGFERRIGRNIEQREARREARRLQLEAMRAKRLAEKAKRLADNAMAAAELEREEREWQLKQEALVREREERLKQTMLADLEWEAAGDYYDYIGKSSPLRGGHPFVHDDYEPRPRKQRRSSKYWQRHYVPEWKREQDSETRRQELAKEAKGRKKIEHRRKQAEILAKLAQAKAAESPLMLWGIHLRQYAKEAHQRHKRTETLRAIAEGRAQIRQADQILEELLRPVEVPIEVVVTVSLSPPPKPIAPRPRPPNLPMFFPGGGTARMVNCYGVRMIVRWPHLLHPR
jgi:hypothetical protein